MSIALAPPHVHRFVVGEALADIPAVMAAVDARAGQHGLSEDRRYALQVCLEEVLANLILHARPRAGRHKKIEAALLVEGARGWLRISDGCVPFDMSKQPGKASDPEAVGGRGLRLLHSFAKQIDYRHEGARNVLDIEI